MPPFKSYLRPFDEAGGNCDHQGSGDQKLSLVRELISEDIIKGYKVDTDRYLEVSKDELENIALESTRTIEIDEFVPRKEIDDLYLVRPITSYQTARSVTMPMR